LHAAQALLCENLEAVLPVTRSILEGARQYSALDAYRAQYRLAMLRRAADDLS
jgi:allophanate hydrolase